MKLTLALILFSLVLAALEPMPSVKQISESGICLGDICGEK